MHRVCFSALLLFAGIASADSLLDHATPEQRRLYEEAKPKLLAEASRPPMLLATSDENYFYKMSGRTIPLLRAYRYSHDPVYLETYVPVQEQILTQRYIHPSQPEWNGWFEYDAGKDLMFKHLALLDHDTLLYYVPVLLFVQAVRGDPALQEKYGVKAEAWLKDVEASMRAWDKRGCWQEFPDGAGWYHDMTHFPDPKTGELQKLTGINAGGVLAYNKVHAFHEALSLAYSITKDSWYKTRLEQTARFFKAHWRIDDQHVEWNYRDHAFAGDYKSGVFGQGETRMGAYVHPKGGYYGVDLQAVVEDYDLGVLYQQADIEKLLKTNLEFMRFGDALAPKYKMINGNYKEEGKYNKGELWIALAHFSPQVRELWKQQNEHNHDKGWFSWAADEIDYLTEVAQPVSWDRRNLQTH